MKLIDKDALVAKLVGGLNKYKKEYNKMARYEVWETAKELEHKINELEKTLNFINAFEVKEVDLKKEYNEIQD